MGFRFDILCLAYAGNKKFRSSYSHHANQVVSWALSKVAEWGEFLVVWTPELSAQKEKLLLKVCQDTGSGDNKYSHPFTFRYWWISSVVFVLRARLVRGDRRSRLNHPAFWKRGLLRIA